MYCYGEKVTGEEARRVRVALGESQTQFGKRFGKHRRTVIRWEKSEACFSNYGGYTYDAKKQEHVPNETPADRWKRAKAEADKPKRKKKTRKAKRTKTKSDTRRRRKVSQVTKKLRGRRVTRRRKRKSKKKSK